MSPENPLKKYPRRKVLSPWFRTVLVSVFCLSWLALATAMQYCMAEYDQKTLTERLGDYTQFAVPATGLAAALLIQDYQGVGQFAWGCLTNLAVTTGLKHTINATRPNGGKHSFPSGHTSFAFQGAAFIQRRYGWKVGILAFLGAGFVGYSRVEANKHFVRDVVVGATLGIACSYIFTRRRIV